MSKVTDVEIAQAAALARCKFAPGSSAKRFVHDMAGRDASYVMSDKATAFLDRLAHQYRKQIGSCMSVSCTKCHPVIDRDEVRVAIDAVAEGRTEYVDRVGAWRKAALAIYNAAYAKTFAHPYEYACRVAANNRRTHHRGDIYCRFCGEQLFAQVKQPHKLVAESPDAQHHLTICALLVLAKMREPAKPGHRTAPMDVLWQLESA